MNAKFDLDAALSSTLLERALKAAALPAAGELAASALGRLAESVATLSDPVQWTFYPDERPPGPGHPRRRWWLTAQAQVSCTCERCLEPVQLTLSAKRGFEFFESAALADARTEQIGEAEEALDAQLEQVDFLAPEDAASLRGLIEDELLLELPMAPKHSDCAQPASPGGPLGHSGGPAASGDQPATVRPFAGLKALLKKT